jgi:cytochrome c biogenesis protein CcmG, thiol:disulfide interchange protein DsbE
MTMNVLWLDALMSYEDTKEMIMSKQGWLLTVIGLLSAGLVTAVYPTLQARVINPGDSAPGFSVKTDRGRLMSPKDFGGRVLVLNFWATWCKGCLEEFAGLNQFAAETAKDGVVVLGVSVDKNQQQYQRFLASTQPSFETSRDPEADISANYGTFLFPETYVIDHNGKVVKKVIGAIEDWNELRRSVQGL